MGVRKILDYDGTVQLFPNFFSVKEATELFRKLQSELALTQETYSFGGKEVLSPRLVGWYGERGKAYKYTGVNHESKPYTLTLLTIHDRVEQEVQKFNSVLANLYRTGYDHIGWHQDNEPELGKSPTIASLSLGATRRFDLKRLDGKASFSIQIESGDLLVMVGMLQKYWLHRIPREPTIQEPRLNLTFRYIE